MKLNPDCIRNILLAIEDQHAPKDNLLQPEMRIKDFELSPFTEQYSRQEIVYTLLKLEEADLINSTHRFSDGGEVCIFLVSSLTFNGHQYLEKIRNENNWKKIKTISSKVGDFSLLAIEKIAEGVTSAAISKLLNTP